LTGFAFIFSKKIIWQLHVNVLGDFFCQVDYRGKKKLIVYYSPIVTYDKMVCHFKVFFKLLLFISEGFEQESSAMFDTWSKTFG
jgi:hypothetical protein